MRFKLTFLLLFVFLLNNTAFGGKIEKAFEALKVYNYFKAKELFEDVLEKDQVASRYGLSIIHYRNDNPFHDLKLAYKYINEGIEIYGDLPKSSREDLQNLDINLEVLMQQSFNIENEYWESYKAFNSPDSCQIFLKKFPDFKFKNKVEEFRDSLAFLRADAISSLESYRYFYLNYPNSNKADYAKDKYERLLFEEKTDSNFIQSYVDFMHIYPNNKYNYLAENRIYQIATKNKKLSSYEWMLRHFPENPNIEDVWRNIFTLYFTDFSNSEIESFKKKYPKFPLKEILDEAIEMKKLELLKIKINGKWGFIDKKGIERIKSTYEFENNFSDELALVANEDKIAYIDKKGRFKIPFKYVYGFDFQEGLAPVELGDSAGVINKLGEVVIPFKYYEIHRVSKGIFLAQDMSDDKYLFLDNKGDNIFGNKRFDSATKFQNSQSIIKIGRKYGLIDTTGNYLVKPIYKKLSWDTDSTLRAKGLNNLYGIIKVANNDTLIDFQYDYISQSSDSIYGLFKNGKYGFKSIDGKVNIALKFKRFENDTTLVKFHNGFSVSNDRNKFGLIDIKGEKVFPNIFDQIGETISFPIPCAKRGKWGYVTDKITLWENYIYDYAGPFKDGKAIVSKSKKYGIIGIDKNIILDFNYDYLSSLKGDLYLASVGGNVGVIKEDGLVVVPFSYMKISVLEDQYLLLEKDNSTEYFDLENKKIITVQTKVAPEVRIEEEF